MGRLTLVHTSYMKVKYTNITSTIDDCVASPKKKTFHKLFLTLQRTRRPNNSNKWYHFLAFENRRHRYFSPLTVISNAPSWLSKLEAVPVSTLFSFSRFSLSNFKRASCFTISAWLEQQQVFDYIRRNPDAESQYLWASSHSEVFQIGYGEAKTRNYQHKLLASVRRYIMYPTFL